MSVKPNTISENLRRVRERMVSAASRAHREVEGITLIAVSKTHSANAVQEAYEAGVRHFGENRVQEWESKCAAFGNMSAIVHLIGHLQSNKSARAVRLFQSVDSLDSAALAQRLERSMAESEQAGAPAGASVTDATSSGQGHRLRVLIEVKLDAEPAKTGVTEAEVRPLADAVSRFGHLKLEGLFGVPPYCEDAEQARPYFRRLRELRDRLREQLGQQALAALSMGMSHDFEVAIEEGATEIRVGTALFGERSR